MPLVTLELENKKSSPPDGATILKRRLLGAAVIAALAVIFLPLLLDGGGSESRFRRVEQLRTEPPRIIGADGELEVPKLTQPRPEPAAPVAAPEPTSAAADAVKTPASDASSRTATAAPQSDTQAGTQANPQAVTQAQPQANTQSVAPAQPVQPAAGSEPAAGVVTNLVAWVVQAGSFSTQDNAMALRDQLRQQGYPAFVALAKDTDVALYRVKVGPLTDREAANRTQANVQKFLGRETIVRQYP